MRRKKFFVYLIGSILFFLILIRINLGVISYYLITPERLQNVLKDIIGQEVGVKKVKLNLLKGLEISGLTIGEKLSSSEFLKARKVKIDYDKSALLQGDLILKEIEILSPKLNITGTLPILSEPTKIKTLPFITIKQGSILFTHPTVLKSDSFLLLDNVNLFLYPYAPMKYLIEGVASTKELGNWQLRGEIDKLGERVDLSIYIKELNLTPAIVEKLSSQLKEFWSRFQPLGQVNLKINLSYQVGRIPAITYKLLVECINVRAVYTEFPYQIFQLKGNIEIDEKGVKISALHGYNGPTKALFNGQIIGYDESVGFEIMIDIKDLKLDHQLYEALPSDLKEAWRNFRPEGLVNAACEIRREKGLDKPVHYHIKVFCRENKFVWQDFPYYLEHASGEIEYLNEEIRIKSLSALHNGTSVNIKGIIKKEKEGLDLIIEAKDVEISDYALKEATGKIIPYSEVLWKRFHPEGRADWLINLKQPGGKNSYLEISVIMTCKNNKFYYGKEKYPVTQITGQLECRYSTKDKIAWVLVKQITGKLGEEEKKSGHFEIKGEISCSIPDHPILPIGLFNDLTYQLNIMIKDLMINPAVGTFLPESLRNFIHHTNFTSLIDLSLTLAQTLKNQSSTGSELCYNAEIQLSDTALTAGLALSELSGTIKASGKTILSSNNAQYQDYSSGTIKLNHLKLAGKRLENVSIHFIITNNQFKFYNIKSSAYQGILDGYCILTLPQYEYFGHLSLAGIDLKSFSRDTFIADKDIAGKLALEMNFRGVGKDAKNLKALGEAYITQGQLWEVPVFARIFNRFNLTEKSVFEDGKIKFQIEGGKILIRSAVFSSKPVKLKGAGEIDYLTDNIDLEFSVEFAKHLIPLIETIIAKLAHPITKIKIVGPFRVPRLVEEPIPKK